MSLTIMIVDDSPVIRAVIKKTLAMTGAPVSECLEAGDGKQALDILDGKWVDLALVDINMPVMNGVELIERMSKDETMKTIPVVVISTEGSTTRIDQLKELGIAGYLRKPFTAEQFQQMINETLGAYDDV